MKIKRVDIIGFKSFVDKVSLDFQQGISAILGPNGCGKSNIVDAIRWAMGEQNAKHLRGRGMEDVIFGGSESRKPLGMAEVSMIFDNVDGLAPPAFREYAEIMVTRRLYRNGESEYLLNKTPCRLLDIVELFMDTGAGARAYSIVEQGKIGMILNAKPEERRFLIEEAAGVTKFKSRKKTALRKIEATRQNLLRLGDIISEVRRQLGSLRRQAQKAERFRSLREEYKKIETRCALDSYHALQMDIARDHAIELERQREVETFAGQVETLELHLEEMRLRQLSREKDVAMGQEKVFHLTAEIQKIESRLEFGGRELQNLEKERDRLSSETAENARRLVELEKEELGLKEGQAALDALLAKEIRSLAEGNVHLEETAGREAELAVRLESARQSLYSLLTELSRVGAWQEEIGRRLQALEDRTGRNRADAVAVREKAAEADDFIQALASKLETVRQGRAELVQERDALQETLRLLRRQVEENENTLLIQREELNRHRSRLESLRQMKKSLEGYGAGARSLLADPHFGQRFAAVLADDLEVPPEYEAAVEAVLGERLQGFPAADPADALAALEFLRSQNGRCTFFLHGARLPELSQAAWGVPLTQLVQPRKGSEDIVQALFSGIFLVEALHPYLDEKLPPGVTLVTPAGESLSFRGELTGGGESLLDHGLLQKKREMKDLAEGVAVSAAEIEDLQSRRNDLRQELSETEDRLRHIEGALHRQEIQVVDNEKDLSRLREEVDRRLERLEVLSLEEDQLVEERAELQEQLDDSSRKRHEMEGCRSEKEAEAASLQEESRILRRETEIVRERVTALKVAVAGMRERAEGGQRSMEKLRLARTEVQTRMATLARRESEIEKEKERLRSEAKRLQVELDLLFRRREDDQASFERMREIFESGSEGILKQGELLKEFRGKAQHARDALAEYQLKVRETTLAAEHLQQGVLERYGVDLGNESPSAESFDVEGAQKRLEELRKAIEDVGEVNLTAIEEYQELDQRFQFLTGQQEDLRQSLEGLQTAIAKINRTTRKRFKETFDRVNSQFQELFPRLFQGGRAALLLTDEEDLLETGIEIIAQPPGKKLQNVNLLSGGEKALTAIALIFSIFLIRPSPFCLLDEVDAPLDDANIGRFSDLVRELSDLSQFLIITHSKKTMEIADTLYGVTMEEPGVSKIVSVRINDLQVS
jgi:chromosome segregation protein